MSLKTSEERWSLWKMIKDTSHTHICKYFRLAVDISIEHKTKKAPKSKIKNLCFWNWINKSMRIKKGYLQHVYMTIDFNKNDTKKCTYMQQKYWQKN